MYKYIKIELEYYFSASREASPHRVSTTSANARITSSLETSPASSYSASPLPPDPNDDEEEEEFIDTVEVSSPVP
jgi:isopenicillin N synthase-like dioxygenase